MYKFKFTDNTTFELSTNNIEDIYKLIYEKWFVQKFQVKFKPIPDNKDLYNVILTNKIGDDFAYIGTLYGNPMCGYTNK